MDRFKTLHNQKKNVDRQSKTESTRTEEQNKKKEFSPLEKQKFEEIEENNPINTKPFFLPPPPIPPIPQGMTDPVEIEKFIKNFLDDHFKIFFQSNKKTGEEKIENEEENFDQQLQEYKNEIEGEFLKNLDTKNNNFTGLLSFLFFDKSFTFD